MPRKIVGFFLLSFLSFCFFSGLFLALAHSKASANQTSQQPQQATIIPTPTIYLYQVSPPQQTTQQLPLSPTPTIFIPPQQQVLAESTKTATPQPTAAPTDISKTQQTTMPTPTTTPTPQPVNTSSPDLGTLFSKYSSIYSVNEDLLKKIANCESGFNTLSDTGSYVGMFQFSQGTWESVRGVMGLDGNPDLRKNPEEAIKTAAFMLSKGEQNAWPNCH